MNDQYDQAEDWLEDLGFEVEADSLDLTKFQQIFAAVFSPAGMPSQPSTQREPVEERVEGKSTGNNPPYSPKWTLLLTAIEHVQRVTQGTVSEAHDALLPALCDGVVKSQFRGHPLGGIPGMIEGWAAGSPLKVGIGPLSTLTAR